MVISKRQTHKSSQTVKQSPLSRDSQKQRPLQDCSSRREFLNRSLSFGAGLALASGGAIGPTRAWAAEAPGSRLARLGIELPELAPPVANYVPWALENGLCFVAGQLPFVDGELLYPGSLPDTVSIEQGREAARQCGINILAAVNAACDGDLNRVRRCLRLDGYIASAAGFNQQSAVLNGASDLMVEILGDAGRHTRTAIGVIELPLDSCIEVAAVFAID